MGQGWSTRLTGAAATARRSRATQHQLNRLRTQAPLGNSSISDGRQLVVKDTGGNIVAILGMDAIASRGATFLTPTGRPMMDFGIDPTTGIASMYLADTTGFATIQSDSTGLGTGLAWPWIPIPMIDISHTAAWPVNTSGTFTTVSDGGTTVASQHLYVEVLTLCDGGATAGQVRVLCNGNQVGATRAIGTSVGDVVCEGNVVDLMGAPALIEIQTRVTTGTGNARIQPFHCMWMNFV